MSVSQLEHPTNANLPVFCASASGGLAVAGGSTSPHALPTWPQSPVRGLLAVGRGLILGLETLIVANILVTCHCQATM